jgi:four helix bundle protein
MGPGRGRGYVAGMAFMHRRLEVFDLAVDFTILIAGATRNLPPQWWWLEKQLVRAAGSIALNIAEGSAETGTAQERRFYRIARGSAAECDAALCMLGRAGLLDANIAADAESSLNRMSAMLRSLIRRSETRSAPGGA